MANEKFNIETNQDLTSEPGSTVGLVNPPRTAEERIAQRPANYGQAPVPPKPTWYTDAAGTAVSAGRIQPYEAQIFWRNNVGAIDEGSKMPPLPPLPEQNLTNMGSRGLDHLYIAGHRITLAGLGDVDAPGSEATAIISGYWDRTDPVRPKWTRIEPQTTYTVTVEAYNHDHVYGPASEPLTLTTPAVGYDLQHQTIPPNPPNDFAFDAPLPLIESSTGGTIKLRWAKVLGATSYEVFDNATEETDTPMDPDRPGLNEGDVLLGTVTQPAGSGPVTFTTPAYTVPDQHLALKVRAVREDDYGRATSAFSTILRGKLPPATASPGKAGAPTLTESPIVGGQVKLTLAPPPIGPVNGAPTYYAVYDGTRKVAVADAPLGDPPHVTLSYRAGQAYSFTVVAGNSLGQGTPSTALTGTVPVPAPPAAPTGLVLDGEVSTTSVPVRWQPITMDPPVTHYTLYQGTTSKSTVNAPNTSGSVTGYTAGSAYSITVTATNQTGESPKSSALTGTTADVPQAPTAVTVTSVTTTGMTVSWTAPADATPDVTSYKVYDGTTLKATVPTPATSTDLTGYTPSTAYSITVAAVNGVGEGTKSSPAVTGTTPAA